MWNWISGGRFYSPRYSICLICPLYRHPNGNTDHFTGDLEGRVAKFEKKRHWILSGDININLLHYDLDDVQKYLTTLLSFKFCPAIILPTRITSHSRTYIDHIFIKSDDNTHLTPCILYNDISDHLPTVVIIDNRKKVIDKIRSKVRIFGERNCTKFIDVCRNTNWDQLFQDSEDWYTTFSSKIKCIYNDSFPLKLLSRKRQKDKPWITPGLKISIKHKNILYRKTLTRKSESLYAWYTNYKKMLQKCIKEAETTYYSDLLNSCQHSCRQTWRHLSLMLNRNTKSHSIKKLLYEERMLTNPADIAHALNMHFCSIGDRLSNNIPDTRNEYKQFLVNNIRDSFFLAPIDEADILREIKNLALNKAPGPDNIVNKLLKLDPQIVCYPLQLIYNKSIECAQYPNGRKLAKVVAIYKKGMMHIVDNYRPISLLSCFNTIFEKLIHKNLMKFIDKHNILFMYQFGYRKLHSTTLALIEITK